MNAILHNSFLDFAEAHGFDTTQELVIDCFAGGGGASEGMETAMRDMRLAGLLPEAHRCSVDIAINHDPKAIAMHMANHPRTMHLTADIWTADPLTVTGGIAVGALWASPDCRGFSKAKGGAPVSKSVRSLAWVVAHWAEQVRPREIYMENVEEFQDWGDLDLSSRPDKKLKGKEFKRWVKRFRAMGYAVEWRVLRANFWGAPTIRKRLYIMMRCDGEPIIWPPETHADPKSDEVALGLKEAWPVAADILDWSLDCPSIFMTKQEAKEYTRRTGRRIQRPLAFNSDARIAKGTKRYVTDKGEDAFAVVLNHSGEGFRGQGLDDSFPTVARAHDAHGLVVPHLVSVNHGDSGGRREYPVNEPMGTVETQPSRAIVAAQIAPFLSHGQQGGRSRPADDPTHTITASTKDTNQLVSVFLNKHTSGGVGSDAREGVPTVTANSFIKRPGGASPLGATAVYLAQHNGGPRGPIGRSVDEPVSTLMVEGSQQQLVSAHMLSLKGSDRRAYSVEDGHHALTAQGGHSAVVMPFMTAYFGTDEIGSATDGSFRTVTVKPRFGHVEVTIDAPPLTDAQLDKARQVAAFLRRHGCWDDREFVTVGPWIVVDIGMRMLTPRELASAQGFPPEYILAAPYMGKTLTETDQRHKIGNSVCPDMAKALFKANYRPKPRLIANNDQGWLFDARAAA
ncbi:type II DNA modification methyltransferase [Devosia yakushimensis]|uniref:DNA (cytosine-5-)-methyltransferase n=1 Tax=Devosia yakushimensis TaxID=470028 RepID=A0ABQ5UC48_9HYPH|nr:DNA cytosine methyltransferase [Devosia yakushimensis]GLQ09208.1 type II DNA modification methyltransferase [Devosia yakushimensis]